MTLSNFNHNRSCDLLIQFASQLESIPCDSYRNSVSKVTPQVNNSNTSIATTSIAFSDTYFFSPRRRHDTLLETPQTQTSTFVNYNTFCTLSPLRL